MIKSTLMFLALATSAMFAVSANAADKAVSAEEKNAAALHEKNRASCQESEILGTGGPYSCHQLPTKTSPVKKTPHAPKSVKPIPVESSNARTGYFGEA